MKKSEASKSKRQPAAAKVWAGVPKDRIKWIEAEAGRQGLSVADFLEQVLDSYIFLLEHPINRQPPCRVINAISKSNPKCKTGRYQGPQE